MSTSMPEDPFGIVKNPVQKPRKKRLGLADRGKKRTEEKDLGSSKVSDESQQSLR